MTALDCWLYAWRMAFERDLLMRSTLRPTVYLVTPRTSTLQSHVKQKEGKPYERAETP